MSQQFTLLLVTALTGGCVHTILGPDHYLPFIVLARARGWSMAKTTTITLLCGLGHLLAAVVLGLGALSIGITGTKLKFIEAFLGELAAWLLSGVGFAYLIWGLRSAIRKKRYANLLVTSTPYLARATARSKKSFKELTPWLLFLIFVLGPCEPLLPLIMLPVVHGSSVNIFWVTAVFGVGTLAVMLGMVLGTLYGGKQFLRAQLFDRYGHLIAGTVICSCGLAIKFLGI